MWNHVKLRSWAQAQATSRPVNQQPFKFHRSHIWTKMLDNVSEHLSFTFLLVYFFLSNTPLILCLPSADLFMLINHENRIMTSACIHHIVLATVQIINSLRHNATEQFDCLLYNATDIHGFLLHHAVESFLKTQISLRIQNQNWKYFSWLIRG